jgi:glycosyltransferase involved in cell wall biosynthesis
MTTASPSPVTAPCQIIFNGRFLSVSPTGVHRVARELVLALDRILASDPGVAATLALLIAEPPNRREPLDIGRIDTAQIGRLTGQFWEQISLPLFAGNRRLVNLCNLAPLWRPGVLMIHDAQVHISPASYSKAFAAFYRIVQPLMARRAEHVLTVSGYSRDMLVKYRVAPAAKITVIHNGADHMLKVAADPDAVARLRLIPGTYVVAFASVQKHKNIGVLLNAFGDARLGGAKLVLIGSATPKAFRTRRHHIPPNAVFAGRITDEALRSLLESAACLAFPSTTEGFGLPPLEAMILGCPVVATPCGALPEVCGEAAVYAAPDDPGAWTAALARFVYDPDARNAAGAAARRHAAAFTWERSARQLLNLLASGPDSGIVEAT